MKGEPEKQCSGPEAIFKRHKTKEVPSNDGETELERGEIFPSTKASKHRGLEAANHTKKSWSESINGKVVRGFHTLKL